MWISLSARGTGRAIHGGGVAVGCCAWPSDVTGAEVWVKIGADSGVPQRTGRVDVPAAEHPHPRRGRVFRPGCWPDGPLHAKVAQHLAPACRRQPKPAPGGKRPARPSGRSDASGIRLSTTWLGPCTRRLAQKLVVRAPLAIRPDWGERRRAERHVQTPSGYNKVPGVDR